MRGVLDRNLGLARYSFGRLAGVGAHPMFERSKSMVRKSSSPDGERNIAIYVAVIDGAIFSELAALYGISRVRVQKTYARERTNAWEARRRGEACYLDRPIPADV